MTLLDTIAQIIYDKKGFNILALDVKGLSTITDAMIIAEGNVDRHVSAIAKAIEDDLGKKGVRLLRSDGIKSGDWAVLDFGEVMVHIFMQGLREKYSLEKLFPESKIIDLRIDVSTSI